MNFSRNFGGGIRPSAPRLLVLVFATLLSARAQEPGEPKIRVDVNLVLLEATVKDKAGRVMKDLKKEDFLIDENGVPQKVAHFSRDQLPLAVALVVDLSGSIKPFLKPLRYATQTALKALKPEDEVALFTFSSQVEERVPLTRDKREVSDQIQSFSAEGGTNINRAIYDAARYLREAAPAARRVIVLVSDNVPTANDGVSAQAVAGAALEADAAVYGLKVPGDNPLAARMASAGRGFVNVGKLTAETGGEIFEVEREGSLFLAFQSLIERLKTRYTLGFYPTQTLQDGSFRRLNLRLQPNFGGKGRDYVVLSKTGYYATRARAASR
ncbi:MAG: VWA domain-containing protein [Acidobacteria bacterium]|nr:VWA domain-containing protein [Acidobacteriota bacterium]